MVPAIQLLAAWGKTWLPATLSEIEPDPDLVMWDLHRQLRLERLPEAGVTVCFGFTDRPPELSERWIIASREGAEYCLSDPGREVDLWVTTDSLTLTQIWYGDLTFADALAMSLVCLDGPSRLCYDFPGWLRLSPLADIPRRSP